MRRAITAPIMEPTIPAAFRSISPSKMRAPRNPPIRDPTRPRFAVDQAGLLLAAPEGPLRVMAVTSESAEIVELLQIESDEGDPSVEAYRTGELAEHTLSKKILKTAGPPSASRLVIEVSVMWRPSQCACAMTSLEH
jgi:hypothetical protein